MIDQVVSSDLAALGADGRQRMPGIDELMRGIDEEPAAPALSPARGFALLPIAHVYAQRVAQAMGGAVGLALSCLVVLAMLVPPGRGHTDDLADVFVGRLQLLTIVVLVLVVVAGARSIARRVAERRFEQHAQRVLAADVADPVAALRCTSRAPEGWAIALAICATAVLVVFVGVTLPLVGIHVNLDGFWGNYQDYTANRAGSRTYVGDLTVFDPVRGLAVGIVALAVAAAWVGRACVREDRSGQPSRVLRVLAHRAVTTAAVVAALAITVTAYRLPDYWYTQLLLGEEPSRVPPCALTALGAVAALLFATGIALRRRRDERTRLAA